MGEDKKLYFDFFAEDENAILNTVKQFKNSLVLFINSYVRNLEAAEDIASDTFVKLIVRKPRLRNSAHFKTYLFAAAKNTAFDYIKKNKREIRFLQAAAAENRSCNLNEIDNYIEDRHDKKIILESIYTLNADYQGVLILHYYEDLSILEITKIMKKNKKQIYNLLQRAKAALKPLLLKEGVYNENR